MSFLYLTLLCSLMTVFASDPALESTPTSSAKSLTPITAKPSTTDVVEPASNIMFQSKDGGQTWNDISQSLPENGEPEGFFAGESDFYLSLKNVLYRSKSNLITPVWEKESILDQRNYWGNENVIDPQNTSISFSPSGVKAYNNKGNIYQKTPTTGAWLPIYSNFKNKFVRTVIETSDGTVFVGCESGLYKSADKGQSWKHVLNQGWVMDIVESEGVLIGTGQQGIMRSTDNGEHWEWVISEGGVGIAVELIDGGFAAISYSTKTQSRRIRISLDGGKTWKAIDEGLQPSLFLSSVKAYQATSSFSPINGLPAQAFISSIKQMGNYLICGHPDGILRSPDMGKTWELVQAGVDKKVFRIYTSGNILYAVLGNLGC